MPNIYFKPLIVIYITFALFIVSIRTVNAAEDRIVAIVNDNIITDSDMKKTGVFQNTPLSFIIDKVLQIQVAKKRGLFIQPSEISAALEDIKRINSLKTDKELENLLFKEGTSLEDYKIDITEQLTLVKLLNTEIKSKISINEKELEAYYIANRNNYSLPEEIRIRYVSLNIKTSVGTDMLLADSLRTAQKKMQKILSYLTEDIPIREIKRRYSGIKEIYFSDDLGSVKKGTLLPELDIVAFNLEDGEISNIITTPSGLYIVKMLERKKTEHRAFDEVKVLIREALFQEKSEKLYKEWLFNLKSSSYIDIKL